MSLSLAGASASLRSEVITTAAGLERIAAPWELLRWRCPRATPFQSPAWLIPWWHAFGIGELRVLALYAGNRLVGLAPLFLPRRRETGRRRLLLIGTGNTDYLDALSEPGFERAMADAASAQLSALASEADGADLTQLPLSSPLLRMTTSWQEEQLEGVPCPVIPLHSSATQLEDVLPAPWASQIRRKRRRLERIGRVQVQSADGAPVERALELFDDFVRLHGASWSARGRPGMMSNPHVRQFHREVIRRTHPLGLLDLFTLKLEGRAVAAYYGFRDDRCAYYYQCGSDPVVGELSVGTLLTASAVTAAMCRGAAEFDFLRGRERYKYLWGARDRPTARLRLTA
jgi:CelD/BcsL family acetyltransferase involved in cellulose biosynthesis